MATYGRNMKLTIDASHRAAVHHLFTRLLGCDTREAMPNMQLFFLDDGFNIGVYFVEGGALSDADQELGAWLEFLVDDVKQTESELAKSGIPEIAYQDGTHRYFRVPGGPVFRLAAA